VAAFVGVACRLGQPEGDLYDKLMVSGYVMGLIVSRKGGHPDHTCEAHRRAVNAMIEAVEIAAILNQRAAKRDKLINK
jgi:hypothetical protein